MTRRAVCALAAAAMAAPLQAVQAVFLLRHQALAAGAWPQLLAVNAVLIAGAAAVGADLPLAGRAARALLIGVGVPLLLPAPTVFDGIVVASGMNIVDALPLLLPNLALLLVLGCAEAGIYLLATRPTPAR